MRGPEYNAKCPAFPVNIGGVQFPGLTKREYFAAMAMQGMLPMADRDLRTEEQIAEWALSYADQLLLALRKQQEDAA